MNKTIKTILVVVAVLILMVGTFFLGQYVSKELVKDDNDVSEKNDIKEDTVVSKEETKDYVYSLKPIDFEKGTFYNIYLTKNNSYFVIENSDKYYLSNSSGKLINTMGFDSIDEVIIDDEIYFIVKNKDKEGIIDSSGNIILDIKYDSIVIHDDLKNNTYFVIYKGDTYAMASIENKKVKLGNFYNDYKLGLARGCSYGYCPIIKDNKLGYIDYKGNIIVDTKYLVDVKSEFMQSLFDDVVYDPVIIKTSDKIYFIVINDYKLGLVNKDGKSIISPIYYSINHSHVSNDFIVTGKNTVLAIDKNGKTVHDFKNTLNYDEAENFNEYESDPSGDNPVIIIRNDWGNDYYIFDKQYKLIKKINENDYTNFLFYEDFYKIDSDKNNLSTIYDYNNKKVISDIYDVEQITDNKKVYYKICKTTKECYVYDKNLNKLFEKNYKNFFGIYNDLIYVSDGKNFNVLDLKGNIIRTLASSDSEENIGFRLSTSDDQDILSLGIFSTNNEKTIFYGKPEKELLLDKTGKIKFEIKDFENVYGYLFDKIIIKKDGIYDFYGNKKELEGEIDFNKYSNYIRIETEGEQIYLILYTDTEDEKSIAYKLEKNQK